MSKMRAKMYVNKIEQLMHGTEIIHMTPVVAKSYPNDGTDENNTFAKWTPSGSLQLNITNTELIGTFKTGTEFYIDFTPVKTSE